MLARMPWSPRVTASTSLGMGSDVITTSAPLVTSATDLAAVAPRSVQVLSAAAFRSNTVTWWLLFLTMLRHMGPPMLPTPINPTFMISSGLSSHLQHQLALQVTFLADPQRLLGLRQVIERHMRRANGGATVKIGDLHPQRAGAAPRW